MTQLLNFALIMLCIVYNTVIGDSYRDISYKTHEFFISIVVNLDSMTLSSKI